MKPANKAGQIISPQSQLVSGDRGVYVHSHKVFDVLQAVTVRWKEHSYL